MAARSGVRTLLITQNLETIGQMSCNPAIGGIAKGTVAREVDALGGIMGRATDRAGIQFRMLNRSKGPAVWSPRAQCDRGRYRGAVRRLLEEFELLDIAQGTVADLRFRGGRVTGVVTGDGRDFEAQAVVITAGTFLRGQIHLGLTTKIAAGRAGEPPSVELSQAIIRQGLTVERFKTGTPPRIDGRSADLAAMARQDSDDMPVRFSFFERPARLPQLPCYLTWAGLEVKEIIRQHLSESALYGGAISGRGPRYCPSVEDKIVKFPEAERHQIFLEPEGLDTTEMYVNGLSTSLPPDVQLRFLQAVPGLERVRMSRPGYAIEYDFFPPTQLDTTLQVKGCEGLFFAGQINGTTGYEEAAGQGVIAGLNAAALAKGTEPLILRRDQAFIGVLVDDLVSRGVDEPYRLFTSRAEYRLLLRQDNALRRLFPIAERFGLLSDRERRLACEQLDSEDRILEAAGNTALHPDQANPLLESRGAAPISEPVRIRELARRHQVTLTELLGRAGVDHEESGAAWADIEIKYEGYLARERDSALRLCELEDVILPSDVPYSEVLALSSEAREKLGRIRPATIGQAARIPGVSPSDLQCLFLRVRRGP
jgi:tRNA uridine 5-carboxymethylaminomethyl modification enzyme